MPFFVDLTLGLSFVGLGGPEGKASAYNAGDRGQKDPLEKEMGRHSSTLALFQHRYGDSQCACLPQS